MLSQAIVIYQEHQFTCSFIYLFLIRFQHPYTRTCCKQVIILLKSAHFQVLQEPVFKMEEKKYFGL